MSHHHEKQNRRKEPGIYRGLRYAEKYFKARGNMDRIVSEFYSALEDMNSPRWDAWKKGYLSIKPFSIQIRECKKNGNLYLENCCHCSGTLLICKKYGGQCISSKCRDDRVLEALTHIKELTKEESK